MSEYTDLRIAQLTLVVKAKSAEAGTQKQLLVLQRYFDQDYSYRDWKIAMLGNLK